MRTPEPITLEGHGVRLEPLRGDHADGLSAAAADGKLWELWFTSVPAPADTAVYIADALAGQLQGHMLPWAVRDLATGTIVGSTRYHDIVSSVDRVEIGYTWYAASRQRSHVNSACKILLLSHAFDSLGCQVVGFRTDNFNLRSQRAIEALGEEGRGAPPSFPSPGRDSAGQRDVQHPGVGVAARPPASDVAAGSGGGRRGSLGTRAVIPSGARDLGGGTGHERGRSLAPLGMTEGEDHT